MVQGFKNHMSTQTSHVKKVDAEDLSKNIIDNALDAKSVDDIGVGHEMVGPSLSSSLCWEFNFDEMACAWIRVSDSRHAISNLFSPVSTAGRLNRNSSSISDSCVVGNQRWTRADDKGLNGSSTTNDVIPMVWRAASANLLLSQRISGPLLPSTYRHWRALVTMSHAEVLIISFVPSIFVYRFIIYVMNCFPGATIDSFRIWITISHKTVVDRMDEGVLYGMFKSNVLF